MVAVASICAVVLSRTAPWPHQSTSTRYVVLAASLFAVAEVMVVHVQLGRDSHTFSLSEIPLILATFLLSPGAALAAAVVGHGLALVVYRHQRSLKLVFNLSRVAIEVMVSVSILRALATTGFLPTSRDLLAAFVAAMAASMVGGALVSLAIVASQGPMPRGALRGNIVVSVIGTSAAGSLGLLAVVLTRADPEVVWLLGLPMIGGYILYNALARSRRQAESLQFLFEAGQLLHENSNFDDAIVSLLERTRDALRCEVAELVHLVGPDGFSVRAMVSVDGAPRFWSEVADPAVVAVIGAQAPSLATPRAPGRELVLCFETATEARSGLVAGLASDGRSVGLLYVAGPLGDVAAVGRFDDEKKRLLSTIAHSLSIALENGALERSLNQLRLLERELAHEAHHDSLTGLANRALFTICLADAVNACKTTGKPFATLYLDLDDFKTVNDSLGHDAGDALLVCVANRLRACLGPDDVAARLGGDEFAIMASALGLDQAEALAKSILAALDEPVVVAGHRRTVSASIGIALGRADTDVVDILKAADVAMYNAKSGGKRRTSVFNPAMQREVLARYELADGVKRASELGQLRVHFQPIFDLRTNAIVSAETLVRWKHPTQGTLFPDRFITVAEESGAIGHITRFVVTRACEIIARVPRRMLPSIAVNVSALDLRDDDLLNFIGESLRSKDIEPGRFTIEITESVLLDENAPRALSALRSSGVRVALDDFGTGYSSLHTLRSLPIDELKIAKPFVDDLDPDPRSGDFIRAITTLGHRLGLDIVAEGIEQAGQPAVLERLGCNRGQGYFFARPMAEEVFEAYLRRLDVAADDSLSGRPSQASIDVAGR